MLSASSTARTWKVWSPGVIAASCASVYVFGLVQSAYEALSRRHWKSRSCGAVKLSVELNVSTSEPPDASRAGTAGGSSSTTVHVRLTVVALLDESVAR